MAENLNFKTEDSFCIEDNESKCSEYGRLYTWHAAMKACPAGWHLPSKTEYELLTKSKGEIPNSYRSGIRSVYGSFVYGKASFLELYGK